VFGHVPGTFIAGAYGSGWVPAASLRQQQPRASFAIRLVGAGRTVVDSADGVATLEAMSSHRNFRPAQHSKLVSDQPIAAPDEHAQLVEADQRFQAALDQAIAKGRERIEAVEATVQLRRHTKLSR
jgi:hypothetical protein